MSRIKRELRFVGKFSVIGLLNCVVGYGLIFFLMMLGLSPIFSNMIGYGIGFFIMFFGGKHFVFQTEKSKGKKEILRSFIIFICAFSINLIVLKICLACSLNPYLSQFQAGGTYSLFFYLLSRNWVFSDCSKEG